MAKPEWGTKRECAECGARFYDLTRTPIICPKCETTFIIEVPKPSSRSKAKAAAAPKPTVVEAEEGATDDEAELLKTVGIEEDDSEEDEEDGVVGDVFVEDDEDEEDVSAVLDTPVTPGATE